MNNETVLEISIKIAEQYAATNHSIGAEDLIVEVKNAQSKNTKSLFGDLANVITVGGAILSVVKYVYDCYATGNKTLEPEELDAELEEQLGQQDVLTDEELAKIKKMVMKKFKYMV